MAKKLWGATGCSLRDAIRMTSSTKFGNSSSHHWALLAQPRQTRSRLTAKPFAPLRLRGLLEPQPPRASRWMKRFNTERVNAASLDRSMFGGAEAADRVAGTDEVSRGAVGWLECAQENCARAAKKEPARTRQPRADGESMVDRISDLVANLASTLGSLDAKVDSKGRCNDTRRLPSYAISIGAVGAPFFLP